MRFNAGGLAGRFSVGRGEAGPVTRCPCSRSGRAHRSYAEDACRVRPRPLVLADPLCRTTARVRGAAGQGSARGASSCRDASLSVRL